MTENSTVLIGSNVVVDGKLLPREFGIQVEYEYSREGYVFEYLGSEPNIRNPILKFTAWLTMRNEDGEYEKLVRISDQSTVKFDYGNHSAELFLALNQMTLKK